MQFHKRAKREGDTRRAWYERARRYKVVESNPPGLSRVFYALVADSSGNWRSVERDGCGSPKRFRKKATAIGACVRDAKDRDATSTADVTTKPKLKATRPRVNRRRMKV